MPPCEHPRRRVSFHSELVSLSKLSPNITVPATPLRSSLKRSRLTSPPSPETISEGLIPSDLASTNESVRAYAKTAPKWLPDPPLSAKGLLTSSSDLSPAARRLWVQDDQDAQVALMVDTALALFANDPRPLLPTSELGAKILSFCLRSYKSTDEIYGAKGAMKWANGYKIPRAAVDRDNALLAAHGGDLDSLVRARFAELAPHRLNPLRVEVSTDPLNPERDSLLQLASVGITVHTAEGFIPNTSRNAKGARPRVGARYLAACNAVDKCEMAQFHEQGLAFVFDRAVADTIPNSHLSPYSHTGKAGTPKGRPISDCSSAGAGNDPLNSKEAKEKADREWGEIHHPMVRRFALQILDFLAECRANDPAWDDEQAVMWKKDLKGAFSLLSFRVQDVRLMANENSDGLIIYHLCGQFGYTGTPAAFQVLTRAIDWELAHGQCKLAGKHLMYVDDIWGICRRVDLVSNLEKVSLA